MGVPCMIYGFSGCGKSASLRNFEPAELGIFNVAGKPLPFRKRLPIINNVGYLDIVENMKRSSLRCYVVDDSQYLMAFDIISRSNDVGYGKFTQMAKSFLDLIRAVSLQTDNNTIVYFLHHAEYTDDGRIKPKTLGKMIDNQITLEGLFSIVLYAETNGKEYTFLTQSDGKTVAKSPMDMFPGKITNDLKAVDTAIREYYNLEAIKKESKNAKN